MKIRIYYEDTDAGGIVYHTNYLKYCERARSELFFSKGVNPFSQNRGFVVKSISKANFISPAKLGDLIEVKSKIVKIAAASILMHQEIYRLNEKLFEAEILIVYVEDQKVKRIPKELLEFLEDLK